MIEAFEAAYSRDWSDPAGDEIKEIWHRAWQAAAQAAPAAVGPVLDSDWRFRMLDGTAIERDDMGCGEHPALPVLEEGMKPKQFFDALGIDLQCVMADDQMDMDAYEAMLEVPDYNAWIPSAPEGQGWKQVAIFDTEDGPACWWIREAPPSPPLRAAVAATPATESVLIEGVAYTIPEPVALELLRLNIELRQAEVQAEPVAWINHPVIVDCAGNFAGYGNPELSFKRPASGLAFDKAQALYTAPQAQPADALDAEIAKLKKAYQELGNMFHDQIVAQQAAWIEWQHGAGAEAGMQWIENGLCGPGHIPHEDEPYGTEAQAYFDANKSDPFPACYCGRPSNILWMGKGFCSDSHHDEHRAAMAAAQEGGKA